MESGFIEIPFQGRIHQILGLFRGNHQLLIGASKLRKKKIQGSDIHQALVYGLIDRDDKTMKHKITLDGIRVLDGLDSFGGSVGQKVELMININQRYVR